MKNIRPFLFLPICFLFLSVVKAQAQTIVLVKGMAIKHSARIVNKVYRFDGADSLSTAPVIINGNNITVDFNGATIQGSSDIENPDKFKGTGVIVKGSNVTIKNLKVRGFKVGLMARGVKQLRIEKSDFSYNFRQHLNSTRDREDLADWQSYHHNEHDEWLRYGAGIYLRDCDYFTISTTNITNGQCGLMLTNSNKGAVIGNNFSFNSGLGIGMYRSSGDLVLYNNIDWNVRGFSDGFYYRGQDSAGILVFEQCCNNVIARNSVTHSGDGFFLWAGQSTMDTGRGGCNDNLLYGNDFSYAPTNGVELTFSRNQVIGNIIHDCWHGVWAGFSYNTVIAHNDFEGNMSTIAIEHGMNNTIAQNKFNNEKVAIELWSNPKRPKDFGYLQKRDTRSVNYTINDNTFINVKKILNINHTDSIIIKNNKLVGSTMPGKPDSATSNVSFANNGEQAKPVVDSSYFPEKISMYTSTTRALPAGFPKGRRYIMMNGWGPYNFSYPIAWWEKVDSTGKITLDMIGPAGKWRIVKMKGASNPSAQTGTFPSILTIEKGAAVTTDIDIEMEYTGAAVTSPFGVKYKAGAPYIFHYREFEPDYQWQMKWFEFGTDADPVKAPEQFKKLLAGTPVKTTSGKLLANVFGKNFGKDIAKEKIATVSASDIDVPDGTYRIGISASELVRLYIDDKLLIENWEPAKIVNDEDYHKDAVIRLKGKHTIRIEQAQVGGYGMLNLVMRKL